MKCHTITECQADEHLIINLDLRTGQSARLSKIANRIVTLNDLIGKQHISANLTYLEGERTQHLNLPAFVAENSGERILHLMFPQGIYVNIRKDETSVKINQLAYHIDKLTETVTETYAFSDNIPQESPFILLSIDLDLANGKDLNTPAIHAATLSQITTVTDWNRPVMLCFTKQNTINKTQDFFYQFVDNLQVIGTLPAQMIAMTATITHTPLADLVNGNRIAFQFVIGNNQIAMLNITRAKSDEVIFLYENDDNIISSGEFHPSSFSNAVTWSHLGELLSKGIRPAIYLGSPASGGYHPAHYKLTPDAENPAMFTGYIEIHYTEDDGNGQTHLVVDRRDVSITNGYGNYTRTCKRCLLS